MCSRLCSQEDHGLIITLPPLHVEVLGESHILPHLVAGNWTLLCMLTQTLPSELHLYPQIGHSGSWNRTAEMMEPLKLLHGDCTSRQRGSAMIQIDSTNFITPALDRKENKNIWRERKTQVRLCFQINTKIRRSWLNRRGAILLATVSICPF